MNNRKKKIDVKSIALMGLLIALGIILSRFLSIAAWNLKIGFSFIPVVIAAILLGPVEAALVGAIADFLGAVLFPIGAYFPGFTLTQFIVGLVFGLLLYKKVSIVRIVIAAAINNFICSMLLSTLWISVLYGSPFLGLLPTRAAQAGVMFVVQIITIVILQEALLKRVKFIFNPAVAE